METLAKAALTAAALLVGAAACQPDVEPPEPTEPVIPSAPETTAGGETPEEAVE